MRLPALILAALSLAACGAQEPSAAPRPASSTAQPALTAEGPAASLKADDSDAANMGAWVVRVDDLAEQGDVTVKFYGMAGGDPAMNGLQTYLAFYLSPDQGWRVFQVGDVLDYRILSETPGRVDLELSESHLDDATGEIGSRFRRVIVAWTPGVGDGPPTNVTVTPAQ